MDTFYSKYIKYKSKYFELKGYSVDKITMYKDPINTNDTYYGKYIKYKIKYFKQIGLVGGVLGTGPCPETFGILHRSIFWYLRNTLCNYDVFSKKIPKDDKMWTNFTWDNFVRTNEERKHEETVIYVEDLKTRRFPALYLKHKEFPLDRLREGGYTISELINDKTYTDNGKKVEVEGYTVAELKGVGYSIDEFKAYKKEEELSVLKHEGKSNAKLLAYFKELEKLKPLTIKDLLGANFTIEEIVEIGFNLWEFVNAYKYKVLDATQFMEATQFMDAENIGSKIKKLSGDIISTIIKELKGKNYKIDQLKIFSAELLIEAGFTLNDFLNSVDLKELTDIDYIFNHFLIRDLKKAGFAHKQILQYIQINKEKFIQLKLNGFTIDEIFKGVNEHVIERVNESEVARLLRYVGFSINEFIKADLIRILKDAGFTIRELRSVGFDINGLKTIGFTVSEFKCARVTALELKDAEFGVIALKGAGFTAIALKSAGFNVSELKDDKFDIYDLKNAGFSISELKDAMVDIIDLKCAGFSVNELISIGFTIGDVINAGFIARELMKDGFTVSELIKNGIITSQLKSAGFTIEDFINAELNKSDLISAGFSETDIKCYDFKQKNDTVTLLKSKGYDVTNLKNAGFTANELKRGGFTKNDLKNKGFTVNELINAGYTAEELKSNSGITVYELKRTGLDVETLRNIGFTATELKSSGFTVLELIDYFSYYNLKMAKFTADDYKDANINTRRINEWTFSKRELICAGFGLNILEYDGLTIDNLSELRYAGFNASELEHTGFRVSVLIDAGFTVIELIKGGINLQKLKKNEVSASELRNAGVSVSNLKDLGFQEKDLRDIGVSAKELKDAKFDIKKIIPLFTPSELKRNEFTIDDLISGGYDAEKLIEAGFSIDDLIAAGFIPEKLKTAGLM